MSTQNLVILMFCSVRVEIATRMFQGNANMINKRFNEDLNLISIN